MKTLPVATKGLAYVVGGLVVAGAVAAATVLGRRSTQKSVAPASASTDAWPEGWGVAGCDDLLGDGICGIEEDRTDAMRVSVWVPGTAGSAARVLAPPQSADEGSAPREVEGGWLHEIAVMPKDRSIELAIAIDGRERVVRLAVEPFATPALVRRAKDVPKEEADALRVRLRALADETRPDERPRVLVALASVTARAGDTKGADAVRREAAQTAEVQGQKALAAGQHLVLVFSELYQARNLTAAGMHLAKARALLSDAESRAHLFYHEGLVAQESGAIAAALRWFADAVRAARRLGMTDVYWAAAQWRATLLGEVGRIDEALTEYEALSTTAAKRKPCHRAAFLTSFAWLDLRAAETAARPRSMARAKQLLDEARALFEGPCPTGARSLPNVIVNQALASLHAHEPDAAARSLEELRRMQVEVPAYVEIWRLEAAARLAVARRRFSEALSDYRTLVTLSERMLAAEATWRALVGQARVHAELGNRSAAIELLRDAERQLDDQLLRVPLGEGRGGFAVMREKSAGLLIDLLLREGHGGEAEQVARRARVRPLLALARLGRLAALSADRRRSWDTAVARFLHERSDLETAARDDWRLAAADRAKATAERQAHTQAARQALEQALETLEGQASDPWSEPGLEEGQVLLGYFPVPGGWLGFAQTDTNTRLARIPERPAAIADDADPTAASPAVLSEWLLAPFASVITSAKTMRLLTYGALARVDFHALPFEGAPLIARLPVEYSLDLKPVAATERAAQAGSKLGGVALLVADPRGDLPAAREEARVVLALWEGRKLHVERAFGLEATRAHLLARLPEVGLFHYAGHARHAGLEGLDSTLPLADGGAVSSADILTLGRVPEEVVLSACEAARTDARAALELGTGQAFLVSGSRSVVAATRPVRDDVARALAVGFHASDAADPRAKLRVAVLAMMGEHPDWDWSSFRALAP